jgi:hypothetical protein
MPAHECQILLVSCQVSLYINLRCFVSNCYISVYMLDCNMSNAVTIAMSFSMTTEQVGHLIIYIYYPTMILHIAVTEKKLLLYHHGFSLYLRLQVFQFVSISKYQVISWVTCISVCRHIVASTKISNHRLFRFASISRHQINNSYRHLFRYASISRHSIIPSVIANSGSLIYRDSDLKANKYHISYHIRSNIVFRFDILT